MLEKIENEEQEDKKISEGMAKVCFIMPKELLQKIDSLEIKEKVVASKIFKLHIQRLVNDVEAFLSLLVDAEKADKKAEADNGKV